MAHIRLFGIVKNVSMKKWGGTPIDVPTLIPLLPHAILNEGRSLGMVTRPVGPK